MKIYKILLICNLLFFSFSFSYAIENKPTDTTNISIYDDTINMSGILNFVSGSEIDKRYTKSIDYRCDLFLQECTLLTANYVYNGKYSPQLYPTSNSCEIVNNENNIIISKCGSCLIKVDKLKQTLNMICPSLNNNNETIYQLNK